ncbi:MAG: PepSY domain-containing protein [Planctomycetaceae bacterium]|jgi:uncharacterized iron-regulated membrane protein|nr:PepSY domain-containing protein [Planctomycetaceae bacterium]
MSSKFGVNKLFRRFCYEIHLWLGIVSGLVLFLVCLSGTTLVFREEIVRLAEPAKYYVDVPPNAAKMPVDEIIAKLEAGNIPEYAGMKVSGIAIPKAANRTITVTLTTPRPQGERSEGAGRRGQRPDGEQPQGERSEGAGRRGQRPDGEQPQGERSEGAGRRGQRPDSEQPQGERGQNRGGQQGGGGMRGGGKMVLVNPYTAEIVAEGGGRNSGGKLGAFFMSMTQLHRNLWISYRLESLGPRASLGGLIVGISTIIFVAVSLTGLVLWFPRTWQSWKRWASWKQGLTVKFRSGIWRFIYDSHNTIGFYFLIPCLIMALTGLCWSFSWYRDGASAVLGDQIFKQRMQRPEKIELPAEGAVPMPIGQILERQRELTPDFGDISISIPQDRESAMVIQTGRSGFFALAIKDKTQWDRFRGEVIPVESFGKRVEVERFADKPFGAQIAAAVRPLHFGDITGLSSKILFFFACLFATTLPITGVVLWIRKLLKKRGGCKSCSQ